MQIKHPLFTQVDDYIINKLYIRNYERGSIVHNEGDFCDEIGIILSGHVSISTITNAEKEETIKLLSTNDVFGDVLIFTTNPYYLGNIITTKSTVVAFMKKDDLIYAMQNSKSFLNNWLTYTSNKMYITNFQNKLLAHKNIKDRLLFYLSSEQKCLHTNNINIGSVTLLAKRLSLPRPSVSRELTKLTNDGFISKERNVITIL